MRRKNALLATVFLLVSCSRLETLTPELLDHAEARWNSAKPATYRLVIEMKGDRVDKERFDVSVRDGAAASLQRNGRPVKPASGQDYSMDGLFRMLHQEMDLAKNPMLLGAPEGYSAYPMARFDDQTGRLIEYRRTVGGASNTINIRVLAFEIGQ